MAKKEKKYRSAKDDSKNRDRRDSTLFTLPEGYEWFKPKADTKYTLAILPFLAGKRHPKRKEGETAWSLEVHVHREVGPNNKQFICPQRMIDEACPVCEAQAEMKEDSDTDEDAIKALYPKLRRLFIVRDMAEPEKKYLWETPHYKGFGEMLDDLINELDEGAKEETFYDPSEDGFNLKVYFVEDSFGKGKKQTKFTACKRVSFVERTEALEDADEADQPCLDDLMIIQDYDDIKAAFEATGGDDDEDEDEDDKKSSKKSASKGKKDEDEDEDDGDEDDKKSKKSKKDEDEDEEEDGDEDEDEDDKKSSKKGKKDEEEDEDEEDDDDKSSKSKKKSKDEDEEEDDDDEDEDDKKSSKKGKGKKDADEDEEDDDGDEDEDEEDDKKSKKGKSKKDEDEEDEDEDEDDKKSSKKSSKKKDEDEDEDDEDWDDDDDEDDKKSKKGKKDEEEDEDE